MATNTNEPSTSSTRGVVVRLLVYVQTAILWLGITLIGAILVWSVYSEERDDTKAWLFLGVAALAFWFSVLVPPLLALTTALGRRFLSKRTKFLALGSAAAAAVLLSSVLLVLFLFLV